LVNTYTVLSGAVRGVGDTVAPLLASFICNVIIRVSLAYFLVKMTGNYQLIFVSISFSWALASAFLWIYYKKGFWQKKIRGII
jgi:Na+-driven multidrug efflux pump